MGEQLSWARLGEGALGLRMGDPGEPSILPRAGAGALRKLTWAGWCWP